MKISKLTINSILGIQHLEFTPKGFNEISGKNGEGKTSVLEAIKSVVEGGHDATILRTGEEKGEIVIVLDDSAQIRKRVSTERSMTDVTNADGTKAKKPADALKGLVDLMSVNPVDFLRATKKDRARVLLESMPIKIDAAYLSKISGVNVSADDDSHALGVISSVRKMLFDERTGTNRAVKEKESTINQLEQAMPDAVGGMDSSEDELRQQVAKAKETKDTELQRVNTKLEGIRKDNQAAIDTTNKSSQAAIDMTKAEAQLKIDKIRNEAISHVEEIKNQAASVIAAMQAQLAETELKASKQREITIQKCNDFVAPIESAIQSIVSNRAAAAKREQAKAIVEQMKKELKGLQTDAANQGEAIEAIDKYKIDLLSSLPIKGLEVIDGDIYRDGVQFDRLNTAQQVDIAVEIAKLRAGELKICCVDGVELLDSAAFEEFKAKSLASGLQLFVSRVSDEPFTITSSDIAQI